MNIYLLVQHRTWLCAFGARWLLLSIAWGLLAHGAELIARLPSAAISNALAKHLSSELYRPWALWFTDYYWLAFTLAGPLYFYEQRDRFTLNNDKYQALVAFCLVPLVRFGLGVTINWSPLVRLGLLTFLLKLFFLPYVVSWGMQNALQLWTSLETIPSDYRAWTRVLIQLCLLVDVSVFGLGYLVESRRLGCEIHSVDPSLLSWLVCLWCYPPFNSVSFAPFDVALFPIKIETDELTRLMFNGLEVVLWGIFAWSSLTLGFKASNLTARGIVKRGPYRWLRHPAYTAKVTVWWIQGIIFGEFTVGILLAFTVTYGLRAWTEERHLRSIDADYLAYCEQVRYRFIPGLW